jgi:hypothetical protein
MANTKREPTEKMETLQKKFSVVFYIEEKEKAIM